MKREAILPSRVTLRRPRWHERRNGDAWAISVEWEPRDLWIGVFVKRERRFAIEPAVHVYVCPLPTVVLHFMWAGATEHQKASAAAQTGTQQPEVDAS